MKEVGIVHLSIGKWRNWPSTRLPDLSIGRARARARARRQMRTYKFWLWCFFLPPILLSFSYFTGEAFKLDLIYLHLVFICFASVNGSWTVSRTSWVFGLSQPKWKEMSSQWVERNTGLEVRRADFSMNLMNNFTNHSTNSNEGVGLRYFLSLHLVDFMSVSNLPDNSWPLHCPRGSVFCFWSLCVSGCCWSAWVPVLLGECTSSVTKSNAHDTPAFCLVYTMRTIIFTQLTSQGCRLNELIVVTNF